MRTTALHDGWVLTADAATVPDSAPAAARSALVGEGVPATIPGTFHTDLLAAGLIEDPYLDDQEGVLRWTFPVDWTYRAGVPAELLTPADAGERVDLVFDGLDTLATVTLGGAVLGRTANMHRSYRFDARAAVPSSAAPSSPVPDAAGPGEAGPRTPGAVPLVVDLASATTFGEAERVRYGDRPNAYPTPFQFVRKMACSFGWDWGPDLRTAGIWKGVRVERWRTARLAQVRPLVTVDLGAEGALPEGASKAPGRVEVHVDVERSGTGEQGAGEDDVDLVAEVTLTLPSGARHRAEVTIPAGASGGVGHLDVPDAPVWWPVGYGAQPLADLTVELRAAADLQAAREPLDRWTRRIGFRTAAVDTTPDAAGTPFTLLVNGRPVFAKGVNWIPDDHLVTRITRERLAERLDQALAAHVNLVRVWGGGMYESEDFYDLADECGLLVWQDFLLACAAYPEEEPLRGELEAEARENVVRLMPHASLVIWNGGNENVWGHEDWGWREALERADGTSLTWGERYATELFPAVLAELDPTRPYSVNSPANPPSTPGGPDSLHPNDPDHGTHHQWEVWNRVDYRAYRDEVPRFCSEFGFQGPPAWRTLTDAVHADDGTPLADAAEPRAQHAWGVHQKAAAGDLKLDAGMAPHLGVPAGFVDWHWAAQLNQAHAVRFALEHYRSWWPRTAGAVVWQLNDCWPVTSWAAVDGAGRRKPLWFALRAAFAPRLLAVVERDGALAVAVVNDTPEPFEGELAVRRETFAGGRLAGASLPFAVAPRAVALLPLPDDAARPGDPAREVLVVETAEVGAAEPLRAVHLFTPVRDADLDPQPLDVEVTPTAEGYRVDVTARSLAVDIAVHADRVAADARTDAGLVSLPAGARTSFHLTVPTGLDVDAKALTTAPVLRTANDLRAAPRSTTEVPVLPTSLAAAPVHAGPDAGAAAEPAAEVAR